MSEEDSRPARAKRRISPHKPTPERLRRAAEHYVGQRECSAAMLTATLARRRDAWLRLQPEAARAELRPAIDKAIAEEVARMVRLGFVDDARYARLKTRSGLAAGRGLRRVALGLQQKGLSGEAIEAALDAGAREWLEERIPAAFGDAPDAADPAEARRAAEMAAARSFTERRRFGKWRRAPLPEDPVERRKIWQREAGAMARAGFSFALIRAVLNAAPEADEPFG